MLFGHLNIEIGGKGDQKVLSVCFCLHISGNITKKSKFLPVSQFILARIVVMKSIRESFVRVFNMKSMSRGLSVHQSINSDITTNLQSVYGMPSEKGINCTSRPYTLHLPKIFFYSKLGCSFLKHNAEQMHTNLKLL